MPSSAPVVYTFSKRRTSTRRPTTTTRPATSLTSLTKPATTAAATTQASADSGQKKYYAPRPDYDQGNINRRLNRGRFNLLGRKLGF